MKNKKHSATERMIKAKHGVQVSEGLKPITKQEIQNTITIVKNARSRGKSFQEILHEYDNDSVMAAIISKFKQGKSVDKIHAELLQELHGISYNAGGGIIENLNKTFTFKQLFK